MGKIVKGSRIAQFMKIIVYLSASRKPSKKICMIHIEEDEFNVVDAEDYK